MQHNPVARAAITLRAVVWAAILLVAVLYGIGRFGFGLGPVRIESAMFEAGGPAVLLADLSIALFLLSLWQLGRMLTALSAGPLFGPDVTRPFRSFALLLFLSTLAEVAAGPVLALVQAMGQGGAHVLALKFELRDLVLLTGSLFLFLLARMLEQARAYEAELEDIV